MWWIPQVKCFLLETPPTICVVIHLGCLLIFLKRLKEVLDPTDVNEESGKLNIRAFAAKLSLLVIKMGDIVIEIDFLISMGIIGF